MQYVPLGKLKGHGTPAATEQRHMWPMYSSYIGLVKTPLDVVMVDGRFRVACALHAWLASTPSTFVIIHDFTGRNKYHILMQFFHEVERAGTMVVLKVNAVKRADPVWQEMAREQIEKFQYNVE